VKRLTGGNAALKDIHGQEFVHPGTGQPITYAHVLGNLADRQFGTQKDVEQSWDAAVVTLRAFAAGDEVLLEDAQYDALVELLKRSYVPEAMARHTYQQGALRQLGTWLASAEDAKVVAVADN